jgi:hypothetical protein
MAYKLEDSCIIHERERERERGGGGENDILSVIERLHFDAYITPKY